MVFVQYSSTSLTNHNLFLGIPYPLRVVCEIHLRQQLLAVRTSEPPDTGLNILQEQYLLQKEIYCILGDSTITGSDTDLTLTCGY